MKSRFRTFLVYLLVGVLPLLGHMIPSLEGAAPSKGNLRFFLAYGPALSLVFAGLLALKLNQTRILFCCLLIAATGVILSIPESWSAVYLLAGRGPDIQCLAPIPLRIAHLVPQLSFIFSALLLLSLTILGGTTLRSFLPAFGASLLPWYSASYLARLPAAIRSPADIAVHIPIAFLAIAIIFLHSVFSLYLRRIYADELTGVFNRRALDERLRALSGTVSIGMIDVDHFKYFNDRFGHDEGDNVLRLVARHLTRYLGEAVYRYGGEEFCVLLDCAPDLARARLERARESLSARSFHIRSRTPRRKSDPDVNRFPASIGPAEATVVQLTFSAGLASSSGTASIACAQALLQRADEALYRAKQEGRNRVVPA